jgi:tRNA(Ile)-lysidine synthase TilS/MesJ
VSYATPLETRLAKKVTRAIVEYGLIEDGDRVMVGLSGGKDSWALFQILDVLRKRAPDFVFAGRRERQLPGTSASATIW